MYKLNQIKLNINHSNYDLKKKISKSIGVSIDDIDWSKLTILHRSIDARDKKNILFVYNVAFDFVNDAAVASLSSNKIKNAKSKLEKYEPIVFNPIFSGSQSSPIREGSQSSPIRDSLHSSSIQDKSFKSDVSRPIVVGFGPAGLFASYILALNGLKPIIVERGKSLDERAKDVEKFFDTLKLDENSNVCFGEGGAGAFSDGKLNTNNKDKTGIYKFVLETFVDFGADKKILYENLPHIGTDKLVDVIKNMREEILKLGGEIYYNTRFNIKDGEFGFSSISEDVAHIVRDDEKHTVRDDEKCAASDDEKCTASDNEKCAASDDEKCAASDDEKCAASDDEKHIISGGDGRMMPVPTISKDTPVILAIGNSSRDTFRELIENGFDVKAKAIAVGYRIAHRQSFIDEAQYGVAHTVRDDEKHTVRDAEKHTVRNDEKHTVRDDEKHMISTPTKESLKCFATTVSAFAHMEGIEKILGPATYKLTYDVGNGHSVYSFCMCPGGYIINSSNFKGMLSINGMSYNDRSGKWANSAIVETISPKDVAHIVRDDEKHIVHDDEKHSTCGDSIKKSDECSALQMIEFQEKVEKAAFELEKGFIPYVTSGGLDICSEEMFKGKAKYCEKLKYVYDDLGLSFDINKDIEMALMHFNKIIPGFFEKDIRLNDCGGEDAKTKCKDNLQYIIAGVETRTSSPVKLDRNENYMCNVANFYPCGEGLGHGGGIMSCAVDGINVAFAVIKKFYSDE